MIDFWQLLVYQIDTHIFHCCPLLRELKKCDGINKNLIEFIINIVISMKKMLKVKLFNNMLCLTNQSVWINSWCPHPDIDNDQYIRSTKPCNDWEINNFPCLLQNGPNLLISIKDP